MAEKWTCPYCNRPCTVSNNDVRVISGWSYITEEYGQYRAITTIIVCPNPECRKQRISLAIHKYDSNYESTGDVVHQWSLLPESEAKPFPDYIPQQLRNDYEEACLIRTKSPKASATLSRRCL